MIRLIKRPGLRLFWTYCIFFQNEKQAGCPVPRSFLMVFVYGSLGRHRRPHIRKLSPYPWTLKILYSCKYSLLKARPFRSAYYEPVATVPTHQKRGLGEALMTEGLRRLQRMGASTAFVSGGSLAANAHYRSVMGPDFELYESWLRVWQPHLCIGREVLDSNDYNPKGLKSRVSVSHRTSPVVNFP